jgi:hypothetical protein
LTIIFGRSYWRIQYHRLIDDNFTCSSSIKEGR